MIFNGERSLHGGSQVKAEMRSEAHKEVVLYGWVEDHRYGTYTITLTPEAIEPHQLLITMDGQRVQDSPHELNVRSKRDYHTIHNAKVIKCNSSPTCVAIHYNGDIYVGSNNSYIGCIIKQVT